MTNRMDTEALRALKERLRECDGGKLAFTNTPNWLRLEAADAIEQLQAEIARLQAELSEAEFERDNNRAKLVIAKSSRDTAWNDAIEAAAHLIECDGDAMNGKADAARLIRALKRPQAR